VQRILVSILGIVLLLAAPVSSSIILFSPASDSLSSLGVMDITDGPGTTVLLATDNGRSIFNGTWEIVHVNRAEYQRGPLGDFVTALEYDHHMRLWIGYSNGLQILEGSVYTTINDQQLLKNLAINDLRRRGDEMWVATGHAGLHRYRDGTWTWFRPHGASGLGSYEIRSMAVDYVTGALYCAADDGAMWIFDDSGDTFSRVGSCDIVLCAPTSLVSCPFGGIACFNATAVYRVGPDRRVQLLADAVDLPWHTASITGIAFMDDGTLVIGTDRGIVFWHDGTATRVLTQKDGIGDQMIKRVYVDNAGRIWFFNRIYAGMVIPDAADDPLVIAAPTAAPAPLPAGSCDTTTPPLDTPPGDGMGEKSPSSRPATILDAIRSALEAFFGMVAGAA